MSRDSMTARAAARLHTAEAAGSSIEEVVAQRAKKGNLYRNNGLPSNSSTFEAAIHSIKMTWPCSQANELAPLLSLLLLCPLFLCLSLKEIQLKFNQNYWKLVTLFRVRDLEHQTRYDMRKK